MNSKTRENKAVLINKGNKNTKESSVEPRLKWAQAMQYDKKR